MLRSMEFTGGRCLDDVVSYRNGEEQDTGLVLVSVSTSGCIFS